MSKRYGSQYALDDINLNLQPGEIVGFLGPNGAGKTTLMKIITGYIESTSGEVRINGKAMNRNNLEAKRMIGYLPEHNPLYTEMYVKEYLHFVCSCYGIKDQKDKRVEDMIFLTGLDREQHKRIGELSKGYRQRIGLAQALIHDPQILILDEPTTGLDPNQLVEIRELIRTAGKNKTILFSTHILQEVQALCDRVIVINRGKIVSDAQTSDLRQDEGVLFFEIEVSGECKESFTDISGVLSCEAIGEREYRIGASSDIREDLFKHISAQGLALLTLRQVEESMEEMFQRITEGKRKEE